MNSDLTIKRQFLLGGFNSEYTLECEISDEELQMLYTSIILDLIPKEAFEDDCLTDLKGRDQQKLECKKEWQMTGEELLFIAGTITEEENVTDEDEENDKKEEKVILKDKDFTLRFHTKFGEFYDTHVRHDLKIVQPLTINQTLYPKRLPESTKIQALRLGIDVFHCRRVIAAFGFTPIVTENLIIECYNNQLNLTIKAEDLKKKNSLPLQKNELLNRLSVIIKKLCSIDIILDYTNKISQH